MSKVYDIFTKKEVTKSDYNTTTTAFNTELAAYNTRQTECNRYVIANNKPCNCVYCYSKELLAKKVAQSIVNAIIEFNTKAAIKLNMFDLLDISDASAAELEYEVSKLLDKYK